MSTQQSSARSPRRNPSQARSVITVDAIFEATIQVLLRDGMHGLTTTRVAERAGVSVGTLYQYYPNKQALLYAVLKRHLDGVASAVEQAARPAHGQPLAVMVQATVDAFVKAKFQHADESRALYSVANEMACAELVVIASTRAATALASMLATALDARFKDLKLTSYMVVTAMTGPTKGVLDGLAPRKLVRLLRTQLGSLCLGYLERESRASKRG